MCLYLICPPPPPPPSPQPWGTCFRYGDPSHPTRDSPSLEDDYIQLQPPGQQGVYGSTTGRGAVGPLPPSCPTPLSRLIFRDLKLLITLVQEENEQLLQPGLYKHLSMGGIIFYGAAHFIIGLCQAVALCYSSVTRKCAFRS